MALLYIFLFFVIRIIYFDYYSLENGPFSNVAMQSISNQPILVNLLPNDTSFIIFLALGLIVGLLLLFGVFTSMSSFLAMTFYIISARRFVPYYYGTDEIMIVCLLILGLVYWFNPKQNSQNNYLSFQSNPFLIFLLVQISIIYFFNGVNKTSIHWWNGEAVSMALFNVQFNKPFGIQFISIKWLSKLLTYATLCLEIGLVFLIFSPKKSNFFRIIAGVSILLFHWGIDLFASVTLYKFAGVAFFFLLMPSSFYNRFKFFQWLVWDLNFRIEKITLKTTYTKHIVVLLIVFFVSKAIIASIDRQNERYGFIKKESVKVVLDAMTSRTYSPFRQFWFMFAPSPPTESGYIAFEYVNENGQLDNVNIYGNNMPFKAFKYYHPFHLCSIVQFSRVSKNAFPEESQFILIQLFNFEIENDLLKHPERVKENYVLSLYKQSYKNYLEVNKYSFDRIILADFE